MTVALVAAQPAAVARQTIGHHSKSFALASRLLGPRLRDQTAVIYTWCRRADDAIDEGQPDAQAIARLAVELHAAYAGAATDPVLAAFGAVAHERAIPRAYPAALLDGMAMDLDDARYRTVDDLITYAYRVAGVVGLMMTHVFGVFDDAAITSAAHLGIAMQLTNVCRDVAEDWRRGRLYLPDELLAAHGCSGLAGELHRPVPATAHRAIAATRADLLALADRYYRSGDRGISALPWRAALAVRAARDIYAAIGTQIARTGHDLTAGRAVVPRATKLALVAAAAVRLGASLPARLWSREVARPPSHTLELGDVPRL
jgi:phytoene synthase